MSTLSERDRLLQVSWVPARLRVPDADARGDHFGVPCWGVVDDPRFHIASGDRVFADVVVWWPAARVWTITHCSRAAAEAEDIPVEVIAWQPLPPLPSAY